MSHTYQLDVAVAVACRAFEGGGVYATREALEGDPSSPTPLSLSNSSLQQNRASVGGALWLRNYNTTVNLTTTIEGNQATAFGGAVYLIDGNMVIQDQVLITNNSAAQGGGIAWYSSCLDSGACSSSSLQLAVGAKVINNTAAIAGGGILMDASLFENFTNNGTVEDNSAGLGDQNVLYPKATCDVGEVSKGGWCEKCPSNMYTFAKHAKECKTCPPHANCTGGDFLQPNRGYWHSDPYSSQVHACPNIDACIQTRSANSSNSQPAGPSADAARATAESIATMRPQQCAAGYGGNACGFCMSPTVNGDKYGLSSPFVCKKCTMLPSASIALYVALLLCMVVGLTYMAHATWFDNQEVTSEMRVSDVLKVLILYVQYLVVLGTARVAWPGSLAAVVSAASLLFASSNGQFLSLDCLMMEMAVLKVPMPVVKQLIYLILPLAVLIGVCMASALFLGMTRWWSHRQGAAGARVSLLSALVARLPVIVLVVLYTFYPSLVRVGLSFFACLRLDNFLHPSGDGEVANALARHGYWVYYMQQECLVGWHKVWALSLGIPCVLIFCMGVPVAIVAGLVANKAKLYEPGFHQHFGSLYRTFRLKRFYWEAVVAVQTLVLVCVALFSHTVGAYYQLVMFGFLFSLSLVLQVWFRPFAFSKLHHLQLSAMGCLYFTAYISLTFLDMGDPLGTPVEGDMTLGSNPVEDYRQVMGIVPLLLNVAFVCWAIYNIAVASKGAAASVLEALKEVWLG